MMRNIKELIFLAFLTILAAAVSGCSDGGYDTESRLGVSSVNPATVLSDIVEDTDDSGLDGQAGTGDEGENDGRPQNGEAILTPLEADKITVAFTNTVREGSEDGTDIKINEYVITYYDSNGLTPAYAVQKRNAMSLVVTPGGTAEIELVIVDMKMKEGWLDNATSTWVKGLRHYFLYESQFFDNTLYAQIDFYGRDVINNEPAVAVARTTIIFDDINN